MPYADPFVCPSCSSRLPVDASACPACGLLLRVPLAGELLQTLRTADQLLARLRTMSAGADAPPPLRPPPPVTPARPRHTVSTLSVPKILLGLGALCLLVAAVAFLVAAWSWLGVGGRTAVLTGLTVVSGGLGAWLGRRGLSVAGEALTTVGLGLLVLDVVGADHAGWLGDLAGDQLLAVVGAATLGAGLVLGLATRQVAPQLAAVLGLTALGAGVLLATGHVTTVAVAVVLGHAALAALARARRLIPLLVAAATGASCWWLGLLLWGLGDAVLHPAFRDLWADGHGVSLLLAALLALLPIPFARRYAVAVRAFVAIAVTLLTVAAALPALDEGATVLGLVALGVLAGWVVLLLAVPVSWRPLTWLPIAVAGLPVVLVTSALTVQALGNAVGTGTPFTRSAAVRLADADAVAVPVLLLLGVAGVVGALLAVLPRLPRPQLPAGVLALAAIGSLALNPVPAWTVAGGLALLGGVLVADALRHEGAYGLGESAAGVGVVLLAMLVALPSDVLTAGVLALLVVLAAVVHRYGWAEQQVLGGLLLPVSAAPFLWVAGEVAGVEESHRGIPVLLVVGLLAVLRPRVEIEAPAAVAAAVTAATAIGYADDVSVSLALHLTVAGALVCVSAILHPQRRPLGWAGGALLAGATWVRLWDVGVTAPEAYTLPSAVALVVVGVVHLRRHPQAPSWAALGGGLLLATVPSLLWVLEDPVGPRALLLGLGCLALVLAGTRVRWNAPLVVGAAVGAAVVLRELAPYAAEVPQWALIGSAGTLLTVVGVTWERRLRDLRATGTYLGRLR